MDEVYICVFASNPISIHHISHNNEYIYLIFLPSIFLGGRVRTQLQRQGDDGLGQELPTSRSG